MLRYISKNGYNVICNYYRQKEKIRRWKNEI
jgi:hypothetical protein